MTRRDRCAAGLLALALCVFLQVVRGHADWGPSEGVYALSARLVLHGHRLYGGLVASQPPWTYLFGAGVLAIHDSLDMLRLACGLLQVLTGLLAAEAVWRLTSQRVAAIVTAGLVVVTPWATHQHGLLLPEQLGAPLLLGAALLASRPATARWAGVLAAVAIFAKLPFALPALLLIAASPARGTALRWAAGALAAQALAFTAIFGTHLWSDVLTAQAQAGHGLELRAGAFAQAAWNLLALVVFAAVALLWRGEVAERPLVRTLGAAAIGLLVTVLTIVKPGTGLNVIVPVEPLLATLSVAGVAWALRVPGLRNRVALSATALGLLALAQSASLLLDPTDPRPFHRPLSATPGWKVLRTSAQMRELVARAERCPPGAVYDGPPLVAFLAHRRVPADQPDAFIVDRAAMHAAVLERMLAAAPRCP
ncbi:MAG TPA: hypothetical protein VHZ31_00720 [Solirubrobacteraceae bacterium]|jgi:hypothetical protein|nr:hypothetical protein [Solirubrobacteraceae bacterium]